MVFMSQFFFEKVVSNKNVVSVVFFIFLYDPAPLRFKQKD